MSDLSLSASSSVHLDHVADAGRLRVHSPERIASAVFAPVAMLLGAAGLFGVWAAASQWPMASDAEPAAAVAMPRQAFAVEQAALGDDRRLTHLLVDLGASALAPPLAIRLTSTALQTAADLHLAEANLVSAADLDARARMDSVRATFRSTGLDARRYAAAGAPPPDLSPLELRDARVLAARLDVDVPLARQVQHTARDLLAAHVLTQAEAALPLAVPVDDPVRSSPFGTRTDPFTHRVAFHPGQDFSGHYGEAIHVTAPGVVSFVGQKSGYGNCVEVDHGYGFKNALWPSLRLRRGRRHAGEDR